MNKYFSLFEMLHLPNSKIDSTPDLETKDVELFTSINQFSSKKSELLTKWLHHTHR